ncbi:MAG: tetratricopeptide repeat protein, partial [Bacteroidota bacterium]
DNTIKLEELFQAADVDLKNGKFEVAVNKLEQILRENPEFGKAYNHLGWLHETKFRNYDKAEHYYKLALEKAPTYPAVYTNYAILLSTLGKYDELKMLLTKALEVPGVEKSTIYNEYGIMYEQLGEFDGAIKYYKDCARHTLNKDTLQRAMDSIERCKIKAGL